MKEDPVAIGRFRIRRALGRGAMGAIYEAHDPEIDRPVAIKLIRADLLESADRDEFITRFRREAQAAARCAHPNIVAIYDFAIHEGNPFLAMEYVDGVTLAQARPAEGRFGVEDSVFVIQQVLAGLQAAHESGIVHRDIKPANIMLVGGTRVKLTDFGIARVNTSELTQRDSIIGTPSYMSPEQCGGSVVDSRSDIFSTGIVLFEMLAGRKPFAGANAAEMLIRLVRDPAPDLKPLAPGVPDAVCAVVARSLAKAPADRYASAGAMAEALKAAAGTVGGNLDDRTILVPQRVQSAAAPPAKALRSGDFDPKLVDTLSRNLTQMLGPIAPLLVQSAARKSTTVDELCAELERQIERPADRQAMQHEVRRAFGRSPGVASSQPSMRMPTVTSTGATATTAQFPPADIERLQVALTRHVGPMARVMVKRALPGAASLQALWASVAQEIGDETERSTFLRQRTKG